MNLSRKLKLRPWMFLYAALLASIGLAGQPGADLSWDAASVSPVKYDAELSSVSLGSVGRRSDI